jgi:CRISPR-associated protein Cmr1
MAWGWGLGQLGLGVRDESNSVFAGHAKSWQRWQIDLLRLRRHAPSSWRGCAASLPFTSRPRSLHTINPTNRLPTAMLTRAYTLRFVTPAFLGNAEQDGQWRTPPIKALLRQWWRVAYAADQRGATDIAMMKSAEGNLFGVAADRAGESRKSRVRIRLSTWKKGGLSSWSGQDNERVVHPEVKNREGRVAPVGPHLYLGYGPLRFEQGQTALKARAAIQAGESALLNISFQAGPEGVRLERALGLIDLYGTLGGRSRNGWGSFDLRPADTFTPALTKCLDMQLTAMWQDALKIDWPHAIGRDASGPLVWQTEAMADWKAVMHRLAEIKIGMRTQFKFTTGINASITEDRHWLSYPVTNHSVRNWENKARLPNSLRFKVRAEPDGRLRGVIVHLPCLPPKEFFPNRPTLIDVWSKVHDFLKQPAQRLQRIAD